MSQEFPCIEQDRTVVDWIANVHLTVTATLHG